MADMQDATDHDPSERPADHSRTDPRTALVAALTQAVDDGIATGDAALVRIAATALAQLADHRRSN